MRIPIAASRQHRSDFGQVTTFDSAILRIETADGLVGWGEGKNAAGSAGTYGALAHLLNAEIAPLLVGRDARDITPIWQMLYNGVRHAHRRGSRPRHAAAGAARHDGGGDQRGRHRAVGHSRQGARRTGLAVARRAQGREAAGLRLRRLGGGRQDRRAARRLRRQGRLPSRQDAGRRDGRGAARVGRPGARSAAGARTRHRPDGRRARHLYRGRCQALRQTGRRLRPRLVRGAGRSPTTIKAWRSCAPPSRCRSPPAKARRRASPSATLRCCAPPISSSPTSASAGASARRWRSPRWPRPSTCAWRRICGRARRLLCRAARLRPPRPASFIVEYSLGANPMLHELIEEKVAVKDGMIAIPDRPGPGHHGGGGLSAGACHDG